MEGDDLFGLSFFGIMLCLGLISLGREEGKSDEVLLLVVIGGFEDGKDVEVGGG